MDITVTDAIDEHTLDAIRQGLRAYNLPHIDASHRKPLSVYARDEAGTVIGGLT
ncbi:biphenyl 2,3-dioxygenase, partial [Serratia marcescens subsp. marcescens ATCC 13880]